MKKYAYSGLCLKWVDDQLKNEDRMPSAYADFLQREKEGRINTSSENIPNKARVYFSPALSNDNLGHVGIYDTKTNKFKSATNNGIKSYSIENWEKLTSQKFLGWSA